MSSPFAIFPPANPSATTAPGKAPAPVESPPSASVTATAIPATPSTAPPYASTADPPHWSAESPWTSLTIDITACGPLALHDEVTLWGPELPATSVAKHANIIPYELFTALTPRVTRDYRGVRS